MSKHRNKKVIDHSEKRFCKVSGCEKLKLKDSPYCHRHSEKYYKKSKESKSDFQKWSKVIDRQYKEWKERNKPLTVRDLRKALKKLPQKAIVQLRVNQSSQYKDDPIAFSGTMQNLDIGKYGSETKIVTLVATRGK